MKTISNIVKLVSTGSVGVLAVVLVASTPSLAVTSERPTTERAPAERTTTVEPGTKSSTEACSRFTTLATTTNAKLAERLNAMKVDFTKRLSNIDNRHEAVDQKVTTFRTSLSDKFDARVAELKSKDGLTDTQLAAIDTYVQSIKMAEAAREEAVDSARATYHAGLAQEVKNQQQKLSEAAATFQASVSTAFTTAKADCGNGSATATLRASIKTARDVFQTSRKADAAKTSIRQLAETRTKSIKAADAEFKKNAESYRVTLKAVL